SEADQADVGRHNELPPRGAGPQTDSPSLLLTASAIQSPGRPAVDQLSSGGGSHRFTDEHRVVVDHQENHSSAPDLDERRNEEADRSDALLPGVLGDPAAL